MAVKIITDSACDLPKELINEHDITVLPIMVYVDDKEYLDSVNLMPETLYTHLKAGAKVKTAQIPMGHFLETFEGIATSEDHYIYLAFSSNLSGTYQTAMLAKENLLETYPEMNLEIIDTKCVSLGLGLIVVEAAKMAKNGADLEKIKAYIYEAMGTMEHVFSVDNLDYLFRGGRVTRAQASIGNILNIKPILNVQDGFLIPIDKVKGKKKRLQCLYDYATSQGTRLDLQTIGIAHADNADDAELIKAHFETAFGATKFVVSELGCAVGAHCGPGMISIFFRR
jgi:DegV family protein with EDD domain